MSNSTARIDPQSTQPKLSPMLLEYLEYKSRHPDSLIFFQVGDFYESFFEDAVTISRVLSVTLTSRDKNSPSPIPMAGVPVAVIDTYLERLVNQGYSAAVVRQVGDPATSKGMVARKLERIITPAVRVLAATDSAIGNNLLAAVAVDERGESAIAYSHIQSGRVRVREGIVQGTLALEILKIAPAELVVPREGGIREKFVRASWLTSTCVKARDDLTSSRMREELAKVSGYVAISPLARRAVRLLVGYIDESTVDARISIREVALESEGGCVQIDASTRANLELVRNSRDGGREGTLLSVIDQSVSASGARAVRNALCEPLVVRSEIESRQAIVRSFLEASSIRAVLRDELRKIPDIERIAARSELRGVTPRELGALRDGFGALALIRKQLEAVAPLCLEQRDALIRKLSTPEDFNQQLCVTLVDEPPHSSSEGGIIRSGFDTEIDRLREVKNSGHRWISELEAHERATSGIPSLKIKYNNIIGYFLEVTKTHLNKVPQHFIRRQSIVGGERFTTPRLRELEEEVLSADKKLVVRERELFELLRDQVIPFCAELRALSLEVGELDMLLSFAEVAERDNYTEPEIVDEAVLIIDQGRHPVIAHALGKEFIPNSTHFAGSQSAEPMQQASSDPKALNDLRALHCAVITGPNMGGKSTFLRQNALITLLAHAGSFVPARRAIIGLTDRIFARIGASDNLLEGESTFMVEMREVSHILRSATHRSLVLIDEVGRGTSTIDGLALARAILEYLAVNLKSRTLFATHFHELTKVAAGLPGVCNLCVGVVQGRDGVIFTHEIQPGAGSKSYGLEVAQLAGLPGSLLTRAKKYAREHEVLEKCATAQLSISFSNPLAPDLATAIAETSVSDAARHGSNLAESKLVERIRSLDVDTLTAREALKLVWELRDQLDEDRSDTIS